MLFGLILRKKQCKFNVNQKRRCFLSYKKSSLSEARTLFWNTKSSHLKTNKVQTLRKSIRFLFLWTKQNDVIKACFSLWTSTFALETNKQNCQERQGTQGVKTNFLPFWSSCWSRSSLCFVYVFLRLNVRLEPFLFFCFK